MRKTVITTNTLDTIKENLDESGLVTKNTKAKKQGGFINLHKMQSPDAFNFYDLSPIEPLPINLLENVCKFAPVTGEQCINAIPVSIRILTELADKVVENEEKKEVLARRRAIRMAIS